MRLFKYLFFFLLIAQPVFAQSTNWLASYQVSNGVNQPVSTTTPLPVGVYGGSSATSGYCLTSNGPGSVATFQVCGGGGGGGAISIGTTIITGGTNSYIVYNNNGVVDNESLTSIGTSAGTLPVANGGTGASSQTTNGIAYYNGTAIATGTSLVYNSGNVGIGTTGPTVLLTVGGSAASAIDGNEKFQIGNTSGTIAYQTIRSAANTLIAGVKDAGSGTFAGSYTNTNFALRTDNTDRLTITNGGNVGIGTTAPSSQLDVYNTAGTTITLDNGTSNLTEAFSSTGSVTFNTSVAHSYVFQVGGTNVLDIGGAGLVGIGTTAPLSKLDVSGSVAIGTSYAGVTAAPTNGAIIQGNVGIGTTSPNAPLEIAAAGDSGIRISRIGNPSSFTSLWAPSGANTAATIGITGVYVADFDLNGGIAIGTSYANNGANPPSNGLLVQGNVGIGTATPQYPLDVNGVVNSATGYYLGGSSTASYGASQLLGATAGQFSIYNHTSNAAAYTSVSGGGSSASHLDLQSGYGAGTTDYIRFLTGSEVEQMRITSSGAIGIGTATPITNSILSLSGHLGFYQAATPVVSSCGSGTAATGSTDNKGQVTGITSATACTITFGTSLPTAPACVFSDSAGTAVGISSISTAAVTTTMTSLTGSLYYICH